MSVEGAHVNALHAQGSQMHGIALHEAPLQGARRALKKRARAPAVWYSFQRAHVTSQPVPALARGGPAPRAQHFCPLKGQPERHTGVWDIAASGALARERQQRQGTGGAVEMHVRTLTCGFGPRPMVSTWGLPLQAGASGTSGHASCVGVRCSRPGRGEREGLGRTWDTTDSTWTRCWFRGAGVS